MSGELARMYRMPTAFGPAPGPRNLPADRQHLRYGKKTTTLSLSARTDPERLRALLPTGFELRGDGRLEVSVMQFSDIGWLAGRGYNILLVRVPAIWRGQETVSGHFVPVVWESMADPIITGRDELGWCKIFADVGDPVVEDGRWRVDAAWEGFRFFEMSAEDFRPAGPEPPQPMMFRKYVPRTGAWGEADLDYPTVTGPDGGPAATVGSVERGGGRFAFHHARWEDMPTQYPIVNALADLPLEEFGPAIMSNASGGGDGSGQRRLL